MQYSIDDVFINLGCGRYGMHTQLDVCLEATNMQFSFSIFDADVEFSSSRRTIQICGRLICKQGGSYCIIFTRYL